MKTKTRGSGFWAEAALLVLLAQTTSVWASKSSGESGTEPIQRALKVLLGYPAGGGGDVLLRVLAPTLGTELRRAVTVENKPGAAGLLALAALQQGVPDGSTVMLADNGVLLASLLQEPARRTAPMFQPIAELGVLPFALVARAGLEVRNVPELIALLRLHPGRYTVATPGFGSWGHHAAERFQHAAGVRLVSVSYKGGGALLPDIAAGRVDLAFVSLAAARSAASAGGAQLLAISSASRLPETPDLPALSETLPGFEAVTSVFVVAHAKLQTPLAKELERAVLASVDQPEVAAALTQRGLLVAPVGAEALRIKLGAQWRLLQLQYDSKPAVER